MSSSDHSKKTSLSQITNNQNNDTELRAQFNRLLNNAHENQHKLKRFEKIEFELMSAESIEQLLSILRDQYVGLFKLDACSLLLEDADLSLRRLIPESLREGENNQFLTLLNFPVELEKLNYLPTKITTGVYQLAKHQWLMDKPDIESIAVLPLIRRGKTIGVFCCGSYDRNRFKPHQASDFLQRLSFIMAVCIENALNLERLKLSSMTDALTQVHNRRFFDERLPEELARHDRSLNAVSCLFLDIDHFKSVNDTYGHGVGDDVLRQVAQRVQTVLRSQDVLARYGGEEFAVLLPDTGNDEAMMVAQRIITAVNKNRIVIDKNVILTITISAGVSTLMTDDTINDIKELGMKLLSTADQALYDAKEQGRNRAINAGLLALTERVEWSQKFQY
ncbi:MAG: sensor domain-containing diguanylate cyclase [gamma proteobacterium symbiont of Bathyaustriella thionipta]|nr:sensor domain-containing diguanylate cyclase [gamma proteobacterium symbiont of Bathyaustriella thionipta]MCU7950878.1 sensor domain-containing diguanylate cyclase [gamma proteobacterium symbiont of Bathyaustriella thionipta]MCU7952298.1 sensor domain-containing diguanylate cyclase [gamma proteobacterium symbiont of Bathyaustriella thionipta]MCU7957378.1 sensor domain-containing diguanylate cyclase [gamma proteobacterium symbiont of Bathyaustriella thionipta]